ncbi:Rne/Rng family ribonuclease [Propioniciclava soli]|uniref:Rne/Rng family ribonuclease n=1 Tax=Propioniciclava soli TaxID=2775081 RepID=UPI001E47736A|nr:Rne/Rng family ribonuclease [Propioniciclava soli]
MLDSDTPINPANGEEQNPQQDAPQRAPRRRRAASRPAGPPRAIETPPRAIETPPKAIETTAQPAEIAPAAEPDAVEVEWTEVQGTTEVEVVGESSPRLDTGDAAPTESVVVDVTPDEASDDGPEPQVESAGDPAADEDPADEQAAGEQAADGAAEVGTPADAQEVPAELEAILDAEDDNEIDGAIDALMNTERNTPSRGRRRRPSRRGEAEASEEDARPADVAAALDDLAAALGGQPTRDADPEPDGGADERRRDGRDDEAPTEDDTDADANADDDGNENDDADGDEGDDSGEGSPRRRRRRRGGRRRRRGSGSDEGDDSEGDDDSSDDSDSDPGSDGPGEPEEKSEDEQGPEGDETGAGSPGRRRRRRRRRGEDTGTEDEDGVDVVVKVREPRRSRGSGSASDEITGIEGSTRMEAKRQRRKEGRAAGRRRAPVLSEAEFLARRESVERQMLIRQTDEYTQIGVLEDGVLAEHYVDRDSSASLIGNVFLGRVQNVLPSMEAAFIDIGRGRNAVLYAGEVDWDSFGVTGDDRKVEKVLKSGQSILVQVTKDPVGAKGARLTAHISIPGRYVVYCPGGQLSGISRKLPDNERQRLKGILDEAVDSDASVIVRTAAEGASEEELVRDVSRLKAQWEVIEKKKSGSAPQLLYAEPDLTVRIVRDLFTEDFSKLIVDGDGAWEMLEAYVTHVAPHLEDRLRRWDREAEGDVFDVFRVHEQVSKALERKVHLPSGGSLVIDRTEAMTVIDVNTGKFTGTQGNLEATVTSNNLEAAEEIVRQLRLRDIGGIIVIDFIDMVLPANRELLLRRLVECLGRDRTRHQVAEVTSLGLVQMTRKKIGTGLHEAFTVPCEHCSARGYHVHDAPVATQAQADGGDREGRRGGGNGNRRGGRNRRSDGNGSNDQADQGNGSSQGGSGQGGSGQGGAAEGGSDGGA